MARMRCCWGKIAASAAPSSHLPLWERVSKAHRAFETGEGLAQRMVLPADGDPSSGASRHLLPQGEKGREKSAHHSTFPRRDASELFISLSLENEGAGNAGCALHPRSRVRNCAKKLHTSIQGSGEHPTFPAQGSLWAPNA
jgi:hypothetical protein